MRSLCSIIYSSLYVIAPSLKPLIKYFNSMTSLLSKLEVPFLWITPSNMVVIMSLRQFESKRTKTKLNKTNRPITISIPTN